MSTEEKLDRLILMVEHMDVRTERIESELREFRHEMKQEFAVLNKSLSEISIGE